MIWDLTDGGDKGIGGGFDIVDDLRTPPWVPLLSTPLMIFLRVEFLLGVR